MAVIIRGGPEATPYRRLWVLRNIAGIAEESPNKKSIQTTVSEIVGGKAITFRQAMNILAQLQRQKLATFDTPDGLIHDSRQYETRVQINNLNNSTLKKLTRAAQTRVDKLEGEPAPATPSPQEVGIPLDTSNGGRQAGQNKTFTEKHPVITGIFIAVVAGIIIAGVLAAVPLTRNYFVHNILHRSSKPAVSATTKGFAARVAWTNDKGGGDPNSTNLFASTGPNSGTPDGLVYTIGEYLTVVCETLHGQAIKVGPAYDGPNRHSTVWYELANDAWVPAVYIYVANANKIPVCS